MLSLVAQVSALTGTPIPPKTAYALKDGSQAARIYRLLDNSDGEAFTADEIVQATGVNYNSVMCALRRLQQLELVEQAGTVRSTTKPVTLYRSTQ